MAISKNLLEEIDKKWGSIRGRPSYYLKAARKFDRTLKKSGNLFSFWLEHPGLRKRILSVNQLDGKNELREEARRGVNRIHDAWYYLTHLLGNEKFTDLLTPEVIKEVGRRIDPFKNSNGFRDLRASLGFDNYVPPNPVKVPELIEETCKELKEGDYHPVESAAYAHLRIAGIQTFRDGNKRTARLIQDRILYDVHLPPVVIHPSEREAYLTLLEQGLLGIRDESPTQLRLFYDYIGRKISSALTDIISDLKSTKQGKKKKCKKRK